MKKLASVMVLIFWLSLCLGIAIPEHQQTKPTTEINGVVYDSDILLQVAPADVTPTEAPKPVEVSKDVEVTEEDIQKVINESVTVPLYTSKLTEKQVQLIARMCYAEAGAEPEMGQRLVIDTVFNRMENDYFSETTPEEVIFAKNAYSTAPYLYQKPVVDDICDLVLEEEKNRTNSEVLFFRTKHYHTFGRPIMQYEHHYFSGL